MKPVINDRKCPAQGQFCPAIPACPEGAILYIKDDTLPLRGRIIIDYERCNSCGICVEKCCASAIDLQ